MRYIYELPNRNVNQLHSEITALGFPGFTGVYTSGDNVLVEYTQALNPTQLTTLDTTVRNHVPSAAFVQEQTNKEAIKLVADSTPMGQRDRAIVLVSKDELNLLRQWITDFKAATAASTSLADLKTRVAALPNMPQRTTAQAKAALLAKINDDESN